MQSPNKMALAVLANENVSFKILDMKITYLNLAFIVHITNGYFVYVFFTVMKPKP